MLQAREEWEGGGFFIFFLLLLFSLGRTAAKGRKGNNNVVKLHHRLKSEMTVGGRNRDVATQQNTGTDTQWRNVVERDKEY